MQRIRHAGSALAPAVYGGLVSLLLLAAPRGAGARDIVRIDHLGDQEVDQQAFQVRAPTVLQVHCEGALGKDQDESFAYGWILDAVTREVVWRLRREDSRPGSGENRVFDGEIELPPGTYIAAFASFWSGRVQELELFKRRILRFRIRSPRGRLPRESRRWGLTLSTRSADGTRSVVPLASMPPIGDERVFVALVETGDDEFRSQGFRLPSRMKIHVYCQGEYVDSSEGPVDLGWILDARSRRRVWEFAPNQFVHGGGARKNKRVSRFITLPAGDYLACYATDGSHSYDGWNAAPPYDPQAWGLVLAAETATAAAAVVPYEEVTDPSRTLVSLTRQRDGAYASAGFTLKRETPVRVYSIGEYDRGNHTFADHGWIARFEDDRTVWRMTDTNTHHAGGAAKNRAADEVITLAAGDYVAYYVTDDSHAYREWNSSPPYDPTHWGIEITAVAEDFDPATVEHFDPEARRMHSENILVSLVRVRSDEHVRQRFTLDAPTRLRILALGEGLYGEMYDYGWIEDVETGRWVWEMKLEDTRHAGGARKNRRYEGTLTLGPGTYEAHYVTDGSHAWGQWNQPRPRDPQHWGLTIQRLQ